MDNSNNDIETVSPLTHIIIKVDNNTPLMSEDNVLLQNKHTQDLIWVPFTDAVKTAFGVIPIIHKTPHDSNTEDLEGEDEEETPTEAEKRTWTKESTLFLINKIEGAQHEFEQGLKKNIWSKIAAECSKAFRAEITAKQVESKWKTLKRTYKSILLHNNTSGKNRRQWEYFNVIHKFMFKRPEITPEATCSSSTGLKQKNDTGSDESNTTCEEKTESYESSFQKKRKHRESEVATRHREKMQRLDRFNDIFEEMVRAIQPKKNESN